MKLFEIERQTNVLNEREKSNQWKCTEHSIKKIIKNFDDNKNSMWMDKGMKKKKKNKCTFFSSFETHSNASAINFDVEKRKPEEKSIKQYADNWDKIRSRCCLFSLVTIVFPLFFFTNTAFPSPICSTICVCVTMKHIP